MPKKPFDEVPRHACCVPFAWEEKPGVPKMQHLRSNSSLLLTTGIPASAPPRTQLAHPAIVSFTLCKPPRLQQQESAYNFQSPLDKTASFNCISFVAPRHSSKRFVRRVPSLDHIFHGGRTNFRNSNTESFKYNTMADLSWNARAYRMEDDPFSMAIQACRKEERLEAVYYHHDSESKRDRELEESISTSDRRRGSATRGRRHNHVVAEGSKNGHTYKLQSEKDDGLQKPQMQEQQASWLFACVASCLRHTM